MVAPTANWAMYEHPATQENLRLLAQRGVEVLPTGAGALACGETGSGRMAEPDEILAAVKRAFAAAAAGPLAGRKVVVTAGGTREPLDAVRFIGNRSSGKMGRAVADDAYLRGADVVLIDAARMRPHTPYRRVVVETSDEMAAAVAAETADADVLVMAAAVADFKPARAQVDEKIDRAGREQLTVELVPTVDILASSARAGLLRVGFAAEAGPRLDRARAKKAAKGVDLLVFNDILAAGVGIGSDENEITILAPSEEIRIERSPKAECARAILDQVELLLAGRGARREPRTRAARRARRRARRQREPASPHARQRGHHARPGRSTSARTRTRGASPVSATTSTPSRPRTTSRATGARPASSWPRPARPTTWSTPSRRTTRPPVHGSSGPSTSLSSPPTSSAG